ncbi:cytochrome bd-type quinol oxidase subunit 2 [Stackebrandtia albiflava]|uniref:Cytochrome bd-type quinol oxidase subunit 2 n=1 Tax=Stackebrandtia albiflava TaxID=406432 RepID=A0A562UYW9_9ACTN|nr:cytochrome d ubiquinol oxidase subunit II [Stackebrandtia albiflava]TWJ10851.1 cytochrome bd-type quinol oxidase subunit 2 [Stackebrandtia albiflava]
MAELFLLLVGTVFAGYFALAGYDYGVGILLRVTAVTDTERRMALGALGPFFLGNEVWLVAGLGLLLAAFPLAEGELLTGMYPIMVPLMAAVLVFTAAVQIRSRSQAGRGVWDVLIVGSAFVISFGWGAALGAMLQGFPLKFGALPVVTGVLTTALFTLHGASLLALRGRDAVRDRALAAARRMSGSAVVLVPVAAVTTLLTAKAVSSVWVTGGLFAVLLLAVLAAARFRGRGRPLAALVATGVASALPLVIAGTAALPVLFVHEDPAHSLTVAQSVAGDTSLGFLLVTAVPVIPVLLGFQMVTWWIWRRAPRKPLFY